MSCVYRRKGLDCFKSKREDNPQLISQKPQVIRKPIGPIAFHRLVPRINLSKNYFPDPGKQLTIQLEELSAEMRGVL
jgi:hypothetical protein